jgi:hypothetical protein
MVESVDCIHLGLIQNEDQWRDLRDTVITLRGS